MADIMTKQQRHDCMAAVKGKDTKPEMLVRRYLHGLGYRYGLHNRKLPGSPDLVLRRLKTVIFIHGCFWHGHVGCKYYRLPKSNIDFWQTKIDRNRKRDAEVEAKLNSMGWRVLTVWECDLKNKERRERTLSDLAKTLFHICKRTYAFYHYPDTEVAEPPENYGSDIQL